MTKEEWLKWYEERTGIKNLKLDPDEQILFHPEHGFVSFILCEDALYMRNTCGDIKYWIKVLKQILKIEGLRKLKFFTKRNPKIWKRLCDAKITGYEMEVEIDEKEI